jgi:hypothetical protein
VTSPPAGSKLARPISMRSLPPASPAAVPGGSGPNAPKPAGRGTLRLVNNPNHQKNLEELENLFNRVGMPTVPQAPGGRPGAPPTPTAAPASEDQAARPVIPTRNVAKPPSIHAAVRLMDVACVCIVCVAHPMCR